MPVPPVLKQWLAEPRRWAPWAIGAVVLLAAAWLVLRLLNPAQVAETTAVRKGKATAAVYGTIAVEPAEQVLVKARSIGVVRALPGATGQQVKAGDLIAQIADEQSANDIDEAELRLKNARERQSMGPQSVNELEARRQELRRLEPLVADRTISPVEFDRVKSLVADLERRVAQEQLALQQEVAVAQRNFETIRSRLDLGMVKAPMEGVILELNARLGETVLNNSVVALIGSAECRLMASVNEEDVGMLRQGMRALVRLYSFGDDTFPAEVLQILPKAENQTYGVILEVKDPVRARALMPGMTGEANIIVGQRNDALLIPARAIREGRRVFVVENGRVSIRKVKIGFRSVEEAEILEGLKEGDLVILSEHDRFSEGDRVSVRRVDRP